MDGNKRKMVFKSEGKSHNKKESFCSKFINKNMTQKKWITTTYTRECFLILPLISTFIVLLESPLIQGLRHLKECEKNIYLS